MSNIIDTDAKVQGEDYLGFGQSHIVSDSGGILYATQINDSNTIEVHKSTDGGLNWTLDHSIASLTSPRQLSMTVDELDNIYVCVCHGTGSPSEFRIEKRDDGLGTWSNTKNHTDTGQGNALLYGLIVQNRSLDRIHLVYAYNGSNIFVKSIYSDDNGSTWSTVANVAGTTFGSPTRAWGIDTNPSTGAIHFFGKAGGDNPKVWILTSAGAGSSTEGSTSADTSSQELSGALVTDLSGNRWQMFYRATGGNYEIQVLKNGVNSLTIAFGASDDLLHGMQTIAIDASDNIFAIYVKRLDSDTYYRRYDKATDTWESEVQLTGTGTDGIRPSVEQHPQFTGNLGNIVYYSS